jgi:hypothetical protein
MSKFDRFIFDRDYYHMLKRDHPTDNTPFILAVRPIPFVGSAILVGCAGAAVVIAWLS